MSELNIWIAKRQMTSRGWYVLKSHKQKLDTLMVELVEKEEYDKLLERVQTLEKHAPTLPGGKSPTRP